MIKFENMVKIMANVHNWNLMKMMMKNEKIKEKIVKIMNKTKNI
jgi:hypothetical protein